jgi:hypothetical protein
MRINPGIGRHWLMNDYLGDAYIYEVTSRG